MKTRAIVILCCVAMLLLSTDPGQAKRYRERVWYYPGRYYYVEVEPPRYSAVACDSYAIGYARQASAEGEIFAGGAFGSLAGLGIGSLFAASGVGAAIGATAGLVGGSAVRNQREQQLYAAAYYDCMMGLVR